MTRVIEVIVSPTGETKVETKGFSGGSCREASKFLAAALGKPVNETLTGEYFTHTCNSNAVQEAR